MTTESVGRLRHRLDDLIHQPVRFAILAALNSAEEVEFSFLRDAVEVSDSLLSRYLSQLEVAGYVSIRKGYVGKFPRTWVSLSENGRTAFSGHLAILQAMVGGAAHGASPNLGGADT